MQQQTTEHVEINGVGAANTALRKSLTTQPPSDETEQQHQFEETKTKKETRNESASQEESERNRQAATVQGISHATKRTRAIEKNKQQQRRKSDRQQQQNQEFEEFSSPTNRCGAAASASASPSSTALFFSSSQVLHSHSHHHNPSSSHHSFASSIFHHKHHHHVSKERIRHLRSSRSLRCSADMGGGDHPDVTAVMPTPTTNTHTTSPSTTLARVSSAALKKSSAPSSPFSSASEASPTKDSSHYSRHIQEAVGNSKKCETANMRRTSNGSLSSSSSSGNSSHSSVLEANCVSAELPANTTSTAACAVAAVSKEDKKECKEQEKETDGGEEEENGEEETPRAEAKSVQKEAVEGKEQQPAGKLNENNRSTSSSSSCIAYSRSTRRSVDDAAAAAESEVETGNGTTTAADVDGTYRSTAKRPRGPPRSGGSINKSSSSSPNSGNSEEDSGEGTTTSCASNHRLAFRAKDITMLTTMRRPKGGPPPPITSSVVVVVAEKERCGSAKRESQLRNGVTPCRESIRDDTHQQLPLQIEGKPQLHIKTVESIASRNSCCFEEEGGVSVTPFKHSEKIDDGGLTTVSEHSQQHQQRVGEEQKELVATCGVPTETQGGALAPPELDAFTSCPPEDRKKKKKKDKEGKEEDRDEEAEGQQQTDDKRLTSSVLVYLVGDDSAYLKRFSGRGGSTSCGSCGWQERVRRERERGFPIHHNNSHSHQCYCHHGRHRLREGEYPSTVFTSTADDDDADQKEASKQRDSEHSHNDKGSGGDDLYVVVEQSFTSLPPPAHHDSPHFINPSLREGEGGEATISLASNGQQRSLPRRCVAANSDIRHDHAKDLHVQTCVGHPLSPVGDAKQNKNKANNTYMYHHHYYQDYNKTNGDTNGTAPVGRRSSSMPVVSLSSSASHPSVLQCCYFHHNAANVNDSNSNHRYGPPHSSSLPSTITCTYPACARRSPQTAAFGGSHPTSPSFLAVGRRGLYRNNPCTSASASASAITTTCSHCGGDPRLLSPISSSIMQGGKEAEIDTEATSTNAKKSADGRHVVHNVVHLDHSNDSDSAALEGFSAVALGSTPLLLCATRPEEDEEAGSRMDRLLEKGSTFAHNNNNNNNNKMMKNQEGEEHEHSSALSSFARLSASASLSTRDRGVALAQANKQENDNDDDNDDDDHTHLNDSKQLTTVAARPTFKNAADNERNLPSPSNAMSSRFQYRDGTSRHHMPPPLLSERDDEPMMIDDRLLPVSDIASAVGNGGYRHKGFIFDAFTHHPDGSIRDVVRATSYGDGVSGRHLMLKSIDKVQIWKLAESEREESFYRFASDHQDYCDYYASLLLSKRGRSHEQHQQELLLRHAANLKDDVQSSSIRKKRPGKDNYHNNNDDDYAKARQKGAANVGAPSFSISYASTPPFAMPLRMHADKFSGGMLAPFNGIGGGETIRAENPQHVAVGVPPAFSLHPPPAEHHQNMPIGGICKDITFMSRGFTYPCQSPFAAAPSPPPPPPPPCIEDMSFAKRHPTTAAGAGKRFGGLTDEDRALMKLWQFIPQFYGVYNVDRLLPDPFGTEMINGSWHYCPREHATRTRAEAQEQEHNNATVADSNNCPAEADVDLTVHVVGDNVKTHSSNTKGREEEENDEAHTRSSRSNSLSRPLSSSRPSSYPIAADVTPQHSHQTYPSQNYSHHNYISVAGSTAAFSSPLLEGSDTSSLLLTQPLSIPTQQQPTAGTVSLSDKGRDDGNNVVNNGCEKGGKIGDDGEGASSPSCGLGIRYDTTKGAATADLIAHFDSVTKKKQKELLLRRQQQQQQEEVIAAMKGCGQKGLVASAATAGHAPQSDVCVDDVRCTKEEHQSKDATVANNEHKKKNDLLGFSEAKNATVLHRRSCSGIVPPTSAPTAASAAPSNTVTAGSAAGGGGLPLYPISAASLLRPPSTNNSFAGNASAAAAVAAMLINNSNKNSNTPENRKVPTSASYSNFPAPSRAADDAFLSMVIESTPLQLAKKKDTTTIITTATAAARLSKNSQLAADDAQTTKTAFISALISTEKCEEEEEQASNYCAEVSGNIVVETAQSQTPTPPSLRLLSNPKGSEGRGHNPEEEAGSKKVTSNRSPPPAPTAPIAPHAPLPLLSSSPLSDSFSNLDLTPTAAAAAAVVVDDTGVVDDRRGPKQNDHDEYEYDASAVIPQILIDFAPPAATDEKGARITSYSTPQKEEKVIDHEGMQQAFGSKEGKANIGDGEEVEGGKAIESLCSPPLPLPPLLLSSSTTHQGDDGSCSTTHHHNNSDSAPLKMIVFEDVCRGMRYNCVLDLKMGPRQFGVGASAEKIKSKNKKAKESTSWELGVRLGGLKMAVPAEDALRAGLSVTSKPSSSSSASPSSSVGNESNINIAGNGKCSASNKVLKAAAAALSVAGQLRQDTTDTTPTLPAPSTDDMRNFIAFLRMDKLQGRELSQEQFGDILCEFAGATPTTSVELANIEFAPFSAPAGPSSPPSQQVEEGNTQEELSARGRSNPSLEELAALRKIRRHQLHTLLVAELKRFRRVFAQQDSYRFFTSSLLIAIDALDILVGAEDEMEETISTYNERLIAYEEHRRNCENVKIARATQSRHRRELRQQRAKQEREQKEAAARTTTGRKKEKEEGQHQTKNKSRQDRKSAGEIRCDEDGRGNVDDANYDGEWEENEKKTNNNNDTDDDTQSLASTCGGRRSGNSKTPKQSKVDDEEEEEEEGGKCSGYSSDCSSPSSCSDADSMVVSGRGRGGGGRHDEDGAGADSSCTSCSYSEGEDCGIGRMPPSMWGWEAIIGEEEDKEKKRHDREHLSSSELPLASRILNTIFGPHHQQHVVDSPSGEEALRSPSSTNHNPTSPLGRTSAYAVLPHKRHRHNPLKDLFNVKVRMIDFAFTYPKQTLVEAEDPDGKTNCDEGYLKGVDSMIRLLNEGKARKKRK